MEQVREAADTDGGLEMLVEAVGAASRERQKMEAAIVRRSAKVWQQVERLRVSPSGDEGAKFLEETSPLSQFLEEPLAVPGEDVLEQDPPAVGVESPYDVGAGFMRQYLDRQVSEGGSDLGKTSPPVQFRLTLPQHLSPPGRTAHADASEGKTSIALVGPADRERTKELLQSLRMLEAEVEWRFHRVHQALSSAMRPGALSEEPPHVDTFVDELVREDAFLGPWPLEACPWKFELGIRNGNVVELKYVAPPRD
jgi:hypothetical protein